MPEAVESCVENGGVAPKVLLNRSCGYANGYTKCSVSAARCAWR